MNKLLIAFCLVLSAGCFAQENQKKIPIYSIGDPGDLTYDYKIIGNKTDDIKKIIGWRRKNIFKKR